MNRLQALLAWLEDKSDWLSPIVVKEVRQVVRGREFNYSFGASLFVGLAVAFFGAADALTGNGTSGMWTFVALTACLAILGLGVVPLGAFSALRNERLERTLDLITLTALTPRRVIIGKLLAQAVKLLTLFAGIAPFIATSFLLGGVDFVTILLWLSVVFMWSLWASGLCLFLSTLFKSRAMSGLVFGAFGIALFLLFGVTRSLFFVARFGGGSTSISTGPDVWWILAMVTTFCFASMANLVLLAENRLTLPSENRVTRLRLGFLLQFVLIVGWMLSFVGEAPRVRSNAADALGLLGGLHLAVVALFTVTEDFTMPRRARKLLDRSARWRALAPVLMPGGGRGAAYVLLQMVLLVAAAWALDPNGFRLRWIFALCGYICFFTGLPAMTLRVLTPDRPPLHLRLGALLMLLAASILPDVVHYVFWQPDVLSLNFAGRHLLNPLRTLANWRAVEAMAAFSVPAIMGLTGLIAYFVLIQFGARSTQSAPAVSPRNPGAAEAKETGSADVIY